MEHCSHSIKFWAVDLEPHILSNAIEWVCTAFFHSNSSQQLWNLPEEIIFSCFVAILNDTFEIELAQEDEGYESGSESLSIPTPLRIAPWIYHVSKSENLSFNPTTPITTAEQQGSDATVLYATIWCSAALMKRGLAQPSHPHLWHSSTLDSSPVHRRAEPPLPVQHHVNQHHMSPLSTDQFFKDETTKENFPTAPPDDGVWLEDQKPDWQLCIHDASQPNHLFHYTCSYANLDFACNLTPSLTPAVAKLEYGIMDLMDTDLEDIMSTTSAKDIPELEDISEHPDHSQAKPWFA